MDGAGPRARLGRGRRQREGGGRRGGTRGAGPCTRASRAVRDLARASTPCPACSARLAAELPARVVGRGDDDGGAVGRVPHQARGRRLRARRRRGRVPGAGPACSPRPASSWTPATARARPLDVAASNWVATALLVGRFVPDALAGRHRLHHHRRGPGGRRPGGGGGRTDPERLLAGELVYTGVVRTNVAAIVRSVPLRGGQCPVASELFAVSGDVHVLLGSLAPDDYTGPTPDGRPPARSSPPSVWRGSCAPTGRCSTPRRSARSRPPSPDAQVEEVAAAIARVARRVARPLPVITTGLGSFLARRAAERAGLPARISPTCSRSTSASPPPPSPSPGSPSTGSGFDFQTIAPRAGLELLRSQGLTPTG